MQERYLGDVHDFFKYRFLRHLASATSFRIGLNWYLTRPEDVDPPKRKDGEQRFHLLGNDKKQWRGWDSDLFEKLVVFKDAEQRRMPYFYQRQILDPHGSYFDEYVPITSKQADEWHQRALYNLRDCDFVFLDPDNGFEVKSAQGRRAAKYANYSHVSDYLSAGKAVVCIQFARQCDPIQKAMEIREKLKSQIGDAKVLPIIRGRLSPNLLFVPVAPQEKISETATAIHSFVQTAPPIGNTGVRAELID